MVKIDLRLIRGLGLSLNTNTLYHFAYECSSGILSGAYSDLDSAIERLCGGSVEAYDAACTPESNRATMGWVRHYGNSLVQNKSVWELLEELGLAALEDMTIPHDWRAPAAVDRYRGLHPTEYTGALDLLTFVISDQIQIQASLHALKNQND